MASADLHIETTCEACGATVTRVRNLRQPDEWVTLDGKDPAGGWWAARDTTTGHWRVMRPEPGEDPPASGRRYRSHHCHEAEATEIMETALPVTVMPAAPASPYHGPCAGNCGAMTRVYGPHAAILCPDCREVLEKWRASSGPRGSIPYGRLVDGMYQHPKPSP